MVLALHLTEELIIYGNEARKIYIYDSDGKILSKKIRKRDGSYLSGMWEYEFKEKNEVDIRNFKLKIIKGEYDKAFELGKLYNIEDRK